MKLLKTLFILTVIIGFQNVVISQELLPAFEGFSKKKTSYITLTNGKEIQGNLKKVDRKKGLIEEITLKDLSGKKQKLKAKEIKHMYLAPSGFAKYAQSMDFLNDATQWSNTDLDQDIINKGYVYIEQSEVKIKKKTRTLLLQVLNPSFCDQIKIYNDPFAKETASMGIGGIKVAGGDAKSYFIKKGKVAYKIKKKMYDEEFKMLYQGCKAINKRYGKKIKWTELAKHVFEYSKECGK